MSVINKDTQLFVFRKAGYINIKESYIYIKESLPRAFQVLIFRGTIKEVKKHLKRLEKEANLFGCTPDSLKLLKEYRREYKHIKAIIKENQNVGY